MVTSTAIAHGIGYAAAAVLAAHMFAAGLAIRIRALGEGTPEPVGVLARAFIVLAAAVPLAAIAVIALCRLDGPVAAALLLAAVSVGPTVIAGAADRPLAATLLLFMSAPAAVTVPCWVWVLGRGYGPTVTVEPMRAMALMLATVTIPLAVGMGVRRLADSRQATSAVSRGPDFSPSPSSSSRSNSSRAARLAGWLELGARGGMMATVVVALVWAAPALPRGGAGIVAAFAMLLVLLATAAMSRWATGHDPTRGATVGQAAIVGNPAQALALVSLLFPTPSAIAFVSMLLVARFLVDRLYQRAVRSRWMQRSRPSLRQRLA